MKVHYFRQIVPLSLTFVFPLILTNADFKGNRMHDAQELLTCVLTALHEGGKQPPAVFASTTWSQVDRIFSASVTSRLLCASCRYVSRTTEPCSTIALHLPRGHSECSLVDLLNNYFAVETLTGGDVATCSHCGLKSSTKKKLDLHTAPSVLVVHFKRFTADGRRRNNPISFPLDGLRLCQTSSARVAIYDCLAIAQHHASPAHYTSLARRDPAGDWFCFNDGSVSPVLPRDDFCNSSSAAYLLFYVRRH
jgi:ubiquitin C-terminal hydrolase